MITGGPSTGKTSVIQQLEKEGYTCLHEVIRSMTLEEKTQGEKIEMVTNPIVSVADPHKFNTAILKARMAQYNTAESSASHYVFLDRGIPDILAYMDCFRQTYTVQFTGPCETMRYDHVFLMPPWKEIYTNDTTRFENFEESLRIHECLEQAYRNFSYSVVSIPKGSIRERVDFILGHLKATNGKRAN